MTNLFNFYFTIKNNNQINVFITSSSKTIKKL